MDPNIFWSHFEAAWKAVGGKTKARQKLAEGTLSEDAAEGLIESLEEVIPALKERLDQLNANELRSFDQILERMLYDLDRAEIQEQLGGSDDGFLYARGFVVAAGQKYYEAVRASPSIAVMDLECEDLCYLPYHLYVEKFGEMPSSDISRESCSNKAGWPDLA